MAIRFLLGNMFEIGTLQGERIATPVCGLVRNDREIGPWFLKLMTLHSEPVRTLVRESVLLHNASSLNISRGIRIAPKAFPSVTTPVTVPLFVQFYFGETVP